MLLKCPLDSHAYYDEWGNRYLIMSDRDYHWLVRQLAVIRANVCMRPYARWEDWDRFEHLVWARHRPKRGR